jgi:hypothetical protein
MRSIFKKAMTGSMVAGAALLVAACGGGDTAANNTMANDLGADPMYDTNLTATDDMNGFGDMNTMGNGMDGGMGGNAIDNAQDHLANAQSELQNAQ